MTKRRAPAGAAWPDLEHLPLERRAATRAALLRPTLVFAAREAPYYRRIWRGRAPGGLTSWPFLFKRDAIAHQRQLLTGPAEGFTGVISSGTHHGQGDVLRVLRGPEELMATGAFHRAVGDTPSSDWTLEVRAAHHGAPHVAPGRLLVSWTYSAQSLRLVEQLLRTPQADGRRVRVLVINSGALMPLTSWLLSRGVAPRRFGLRAIGTTSFRLSPFWRRLVEEVWGCAVVDNYSLSELPAPATECTACGFHHWSPPPVVSEVVDPVTRRPLTRGTGVLVVTTLVPFVTRMPFIRYWTDDLVTLGPVCATVGERGFRARGRLAQSAWSREHGLLVAALDVSEFLEGRAEVARHPHPMEQLGLIPPGECGAVKYDVVTRPREVRVRVELRFDPLIFSDEANAVGAALSAHLLACSPGLRAFDKRHDGLVVELLRPGTLAARWVKF